MSHPQDHRSPEERDEELAHARELLERTMRFLARCAEDPQGALQSDDPRELARGLRSLAVEPAHEADDAPEIAEPRTIQIRRRRSA